MKSYPRSKASEETLVVDGWLWAPSSLQRYGDTTPAIVVEMTRYIAAVSTAYVAPEAVYSVDGSAHSLRVSHKDFSYLQGRVAFLSGRLLGMVCLGFFDELPRLRRL